MMNYYVSRGFANSYGYNQFGEFTKQRKPSVTQSAVLIDPFVEVMGKL